MTSAPNPHIPAQTSGNTPDYIRTGPLLTVSEVAGQLRTSDWAIAQACRSGSLRATKPGKAWLIEPIAVVDYLAAHSNQQAAS